jgi:3-deoxy-D-manno-octulosonic-acid transferase
LRSQGPSAAKPPADVVILDSIGELGQVYRLATLVFVGGSFTARGGQNILEPAAAGKPVLFGPNMENFADSVQVLMGRGGIQVKDEEQLGRVLHELLAKPELAADLGAMAQSAVGAARGASERDVDHLLKLLRVGAKVA